MIPEIHLWTGQVVSLQIYFVNSIMKGLNKLKKHVYVAQLHYKCEVFEF